MANSKVVIDVSTKGAASAEKDLKGVASATTEVGKAQKDVAKSSKALEEGFNAADQATGGFLSQLKALATNPYVLIIGAIVGALVGLKNALTSSAEGQAQWTKAMDRIGSVVKVVADFIGKILVNSIKEAGGLFEWIKNGVTSFLEVALYPMIKAFKIWSKLVTGDFKGAGDEVMGVFEDIGKAADFVVDTFDKVVAGVKELGKAIEEADKIQQQLSDKQEAIRKQRNQSIIDEARINRLLEEQKLILANSNAEFDARANAIKTAQGLTQDLLNTKNALNEAEIKAMRLQKLQGTFNQEQEAQWAELMANRERIMAEVAQKSAEFASQEAALFNEYKAREDERMQYTKDRLNERVSTTNIVTTELVGLEQRKAEEVVATEKMTSEQKQDVAKQTFDNASVLMKEGSKEQKAFLISSALMETYKGAQGAYTAMASIPIVGPTLGAIAAAAAVVMGLKNVAAIKGASSGGGGSAPSLSMPSIPKPVYEAPKAVNDNNNQSVKAYIVEDDLNANAKKQSNQKEISSF